MHIVDVQVTYGLPMLRAIVMAIAAETACPGSASGVAKDDFSQMGFQFEFDTEEKAHAFRNAIARHMKDSGVTVDGERLQ